jgi:hypothetical protein
MRCKTSAGSVVESAVERTSRGKSGCEGLCCFPNTGGLHHTPGDAPLETHSCTRPAFFHVSKSCSPSLRRIQVAVIAYRDKTHFLVIRHSTIHRRGLNKDRKKSNQSALPKDVKISNVVSKWEIQFLTVDFIMENVVVCDGGDTTSKAIRKNSSVSNIHSLRIINGDLWVADTTNASIGLRLILPGVTSSSVFICLPRGASLDIMNNGRCICKAMRVTASTQHQSLLRGTLNRVFTEGGNEYCCVGALPGRAERGVQSGLYRLKNGLPSKEWDTIHKVMKRAEHAFDKVMDTDTIRHVSCVKKRVHFRMMEPSPSSSNERSARYYNGLRFGINIFLRRHVNRDFTMSIVQAHIDKHDYKIDDQVICYFAFPRIGIAVALRPGNFLLFNPQEPHCISSCCRAGDEIFCISSYLKSAVVGLNDNNNLVV